MIRANVFIVIAVILFGSTLVSAQTLVYSNTYPTVERAGEIVDRESTGEGPLNAFARVEGPFYPQYRARSVIWEDGTHALRMPTAEETPGGYHYSTLYAYVNFIREFPALSWVRYHWLIRLPKIVKYNPNNYNGHGWLFRSQTESKELFSVRLVSDREIAFFINDNRLPKTMQLEVPLAGGSAHELSIDLEHRALGEIIFRFDAQEIRLRYGATYFAPTREWVAPAGNALWEDNNLDYFSSLGPVEVYSIGEAAPLLQ